ncbi:MAG: GntR family transcriptional regulator [Acutalibacteraceae bacterium]|jgi:GntR family transcriptional regulator
MEFDYNIPIYLQVARRIKSQIASGLLRPGDKLPSNLDLAIEYKINPNTVQRIYRELENEQISFTRRGIGTFVSEDEAVVSRLKQEMSAEVTTAFLKEMQAIGFSAEEILATITAALTEQNNPETGKDDFYAEI